MKIGRVARGESQRDNREEWLPKSADARRALRPLLEQVARQPYLGFVTVLGEGEGHVLAMLDLYALDDGRWLCSARIEAAGATGDALRAASRRPLARSSKALRRS